MKGRQGAMLNAQVVGSDSVMNAIYRGKLFWFWGDTLRPSYPLGNFHVPGATSELTSKGGLDPDAGIDLSYFVDDKGFAKKTCEMPGKGPTWLTSLVVLPGPEGRERMYGTFVKVEPPLKLYSRGLAVWDDKTAVRKDPRHRHGRPDLPNGPRDPTRDYVYLAAPVSIDAHVCNGRGVCRPGRVGDVYAVQRRLDIGPRSRCRREAALRVAKENPGRRASGAREARRSRQNKSDGKSNPPLRPRYRQGRDSPWRIGSLERIPQALDAVICRAQRQTIVPRRSLVAEADELTGPWRYAVKVATHDRMSLYNPKQHPEFAKDGGRVIYFEGTYTHDFSSNPDVTLRYEYNQLMYRLDLGDARTALPRPVPGTDFMALDRQSPGSIPLPGKPFFILPDTKDAPESTVPLYEFTKGRRQTICHCQGDRRF